MGDAADLGRIFFIPEPVLLLLLLLWVVVELFVLSGDESAASTGEPLINATVADAAAAAAAPSPDPRPGALALFELEPPLL